MSVQMVHDFWRKAQSDTAIQARLRDVNADNKDSAMQALMQIAAEAGFQFTEAEHDAAVKEELTRRHSAGELNEEELEQVAGGTGTTYVAQSAVALGSNTTGPRYSVGSYSVYNYYAFYLG